MPFWSGPIGPSSDNNYFDKNVIFSDVQVDMKIKVVKTSEELRKEINNILSSKKGEEVEMKEAEMAGEKMNRAGHVAKGEDVPVVSAAPDDNSHRLVHTHQTHDNINIWPKQIDFYSLSNKVGAPGYGIASDVRPAVCLSAFSGLDFGILFILHTQIP